MKNKKNLKEEKEKNQKTDYAKRTFRGASIIFAFSIFSLFFAYLLRLLLARNLTIEEYGLFYAVFSLFSFFAFIKDMGLSRSIARFIPEFNVKKDYVSIKNTIISIFSFQFTVSTIITLFFIIFSDFLALNYFHNAHASLVIKLLALSFWLKPVTILCASIFQGFQKMWQYASVDFVRAVTVLVLSFIGFQISRSVAAASMAYLITSIIILVIFVPLLFKQVLNETFKNKFFFDKKLLKRLFGFGAIAMAGNFVWSIVGYIDVFILTYFSGLKEVGLYNASLPTANLMIYFGLAIATVILPITAELWAKKQKQHLSSGIHLLYKYTFALVVPFALAMLCFPELILGILFGKEYIIASNSLRILSIGFMVVMITRINFEIILGIDKPKTNVKIAIIAIIFNLITNLILIGLLGLGIIGASISAFLTFCIIFLLSLVNIKKFLDVKLPLWPWAKTIIIGIIVGSLVFFLKKLFIMNQYLEAVIIASIGLLIYCCLLLVFNIITIKEIKRLVKNV